MAWELRPLCPPRSRPFISQTGGRFPVECLVVIPARGGSKGLPRKNLRHLAGRPLVTHSIRHASASPRVTRVVVSTDDREIADVSRQAGAEVVLRPASLSGDEASSESALLHVLDHLRDSEGYEPDLVVFLQATSPIRADTDVTAAIEQLEREGADSLFSASPVHGFVWRREQHGPVPVTYDPAHRPRRQDAPEHVIENGSIYVFRPDVFRASGHRLGGRVTAYLMGAREGLQIDDAVEFAMAEALLAAAQREAAVVDLEPVELLVLDFDGVLTDNRVTVDQAGVESVTCDRGDGLGLALLRAAGVEVVVISTETNPVVLARCAKLRVPAFAGRDNKLAALQELAAARSLAPEQIAYVGNDVNDLACLEWVGSPIAVADGHAAARRAAGRVTTLPGGRGAVREVADWLLARRRHQPSPIAADHLTGAR